MKKVKVTPETLRDVAQRLISDYKKTRSLSRKLRPTLAVLAERYGLRSRQHALQLIRKYDSDFIATRKQVSEKIHDRFSHMVAPEANPTDLDYAVAIREMKQSRMTQVEIADFFSKQETWVAHINKLNNIPEKLLVFLRNKRIKTTTLVRAVRELGIQQTERAIQQIIREYDPVRITSRDIFEHVEDRKAA
jgi:hypothetical protein